MMLWECLKASKFEDNNNSAKREILLSPKTVINGWIWKWIKWYFVQNIWMKSTKMETWMFRIYRGVICSHVKGYQGVQNQMQRGAVWIKILKTWKQPEPAMFRAIFGYLRDRIWGYAWKQNCRQMSGIQLLFCQVSKFSSIIWSFGGSNFWI